MIKQEQIYICDFCKKEVERKPYNPSGLNIVPHKWTVINTFRDGVWDWDILHWCGFCKVDRESINDLVNSR